MRPAVSGRSTKLTSRGARLERTRSSSEPASPLAGSSPSAAPTSGTSDTRRVEITENSASDPKTWNTNRPPVVVVVSIASCNDRNPTPRSARSRTVSIRCGNDRPNRHITKVAPGRNAIHHPNQLRAVGHRTRGGVGPRPKAPPQRSACRAAAQRPAQGSRPSRTPTAHPRGRTVSQLNGDPFGDTLVSDTSCAPTPPLVPQERRFGWERESAVPEPVLSGAYGADRTAARPSAAGRRPRGLHGGSNTTLL